MKRVYSRLSRIENVFDAKELIIDELSDLPGMSEEFIDGQLDNLFRERPNSSPLKGDDKRHIARLLYSFVPEKFTSPDKSSPVVKRHLPKPDEVSLGDYVFGWTRLVGKCFMLFQGIVTATRPFVHVKCVDDGKSHHRIGTLGDNLFKTEVERDADVRKVEDYTIMEFADWYMTEELSRLEDLLKKGYTHDDYKREYLDTGRVGPIGPIKTPAPEDDMTEFGTEWKVVKFEKMMAKMSEKITKEVERKKIEDVLTFEEEWGVSRTSAKEMFDRLAPEGRPVRMKTVTTDISLLKDEEDSRRMPVHLDSEGYPFDPVSGERI